MSSRITYANAAAVLTDFVLECGDEERAIDFIAQWLTDGKSMRDLCDTYGLQWGVVAAWIRKNPERDARYSQAMADRSAFRREKLLDGWWATAESVPEEVVTHGDVAKARESLAKAEGVYSDAAKVQVDTQVTIIHESQ
jgi:hypothetical protein